MVERLDISIRFTGGDASNNRLDMYDGAAALFGLSKVFLISTHFLLHERVIFQAPAAKGVRCYLRQSRPGSWEQLIQIAVDHGDVLIAVGTGAAKDVLKDYTKAILRVGIGKPVRAGTKYVRDLFSRKQPEIDAVKEAVEGSLRDAHRTVDLNGETSVKISASSEPLATFNADSKNYVTNIVTENRLVEVKGNISSYNVNSRRGRVFDFGLGRTVPFLLDRDIDRDSRMATTWSLDRRNQGLDGDVTLTVTRELTVNEEVRRYIVRRVRPQ